MKTPTVRDLISTLRDARTKEVSPKEVGEVIASVFLSKCMLFIAVIMIVYGAIIGYLIMIDQYTNELLVILDVIERFFNDNTLATFQSSSIAKLPQAIVYILCGVLIFVDCRRNFIKSVGLYMFSVGFARSYTSLPLLVSQTEATFLSGLVLFILGMNLCVSGYSMLSGKVRGRPTLMASSMLLLFIYLEYLALLLYIDTSSQEMAMRDAMSQLLGNYPTMFISIFMYTFLIWLLDTDEIRYGDYLTRHVRIMEYVDNTYRSPEALALSEEDARTLLDPDSPGWYDPADGGPVEKEYMFRVINATGTTRAYVQKWKGSDRLMLTLCGTPEGTMVYAKRLEIQRIFEPSAPVEESDNLDIMVNGGMIIHATINHPVQEGE